MRNLNRLALPVTLTAAVALGAAACGGGGTAPTPKPKPSESALACGSLAPPKVLSMDNAGHARMQNVGTCVELFKDGAFTPAGTLQPGEDFTAICNEQKPPVWQVKTDQIMLSGMKVVVALDPQTIDQRQAGLYTTAVPMCPEASPIPSWSLPPAA